jgi:hypothetical protein
MAIMRVKLVQTFGPDVGTRYECSVCEKTAVTGRVTALLLTEQETSVARYQEAVLESLDAHPEAQIENEGDPPYLSETARKRDQHWKAQFEGVDPSVTNMEDVCLDCLRGGPKHITKMLHYKRSYHSGMASMFAEMLEEGITHVPTLEDVVIAEKVFEMEKDL